MDDDPKPPEEPVPLPLDGRLDLHLFRPADVPALLEAYLEACREAGVLEIEVVHGKGTGALRRRVRALLARRPDVASVRTADEARGGWGVTLVTLHALVP
ncbi:MAG TPA: Smr/MutS family protein [Myxococcaceae bacterium]|jgi:DNA-nicking Smr family endonuclease|nr:Smr/MutS family protein [Myxococcaceae bacterium]